MRGSKIFRLSHTCTLTTGRSFGDVCYTNVFKQSTCDKPYDTSFLSTSIWHRFAYFPTICRSDKWHSLAAFQGSSDLPCYITTSALFSLTDWSGHFRVCRTLYPAYEKRITERRSVRMLKWYAVLKWKICIVSLVSRRYFHGDLLQTSTKMATAFQTITLMDQFS